MKVIFFGTPGFAASVLDYLCQNGVEVVAVVSKPDKAKGRSTKLVATPVKVVAERLSIPLFQPEKASADEFIECMKGYDADLFVVVAYGEIMKQALLDVPRLASINAHASLLPKYRGAAPIQRAVINDEEETGITIMHMAKKMDAGDIIKMSALKIGSEDTFGEVEKGLCELSCHLLLEVIHDFEKGIEERTVQDESLVTFAPKIELEDCEINWNASAQEIHNLVRGVNPYPGAWSFVNLRGETKRLKIVKTRIVDEELNLKTGEIMVDRKRGVFIGCGQGVLSLELLQLEGKRVMTAIEFASGVSQEQLTLWKH